MKLRASICMAVAWYFLVTIQLGQSDDLLRSRVWPEFDYYDMPDGRQNAAELTGMDAAFCRMLRPAQCQSDRNQWRCPIKCRTNLVTDGDVCTRSILNCHDPATARRCPRVCSGNVMPEAPSVCSPPCINGECVAQHNCRCHQGWRGNRCKIPVCRSTCLNGGMCAGPNFCQCREGWIGVQCEQWAADRPPFPDRPAIVIP